MSAETTKAWITANKERMRFLQWRWANNNPDKVEAANERMRGKRQGIDVAPPKTKVKWLNKKERAFEHACRYRAKHPQKWNAQLTAREAIRVGKIKRPDHCQRCGLICSPQAHHEDYSKPLDVLFLYERCHKAIHLADRRDRVTDTNASTWVLETH